MKSSVALAALLLLAEQVVAQTTPAAPRVAPAPTGLNRVASMVNTSTGRMLASTPADPHFVTNKTFNHFAAKRQAYYLSGLTNLSLFKNFAIVDVTSGILQVGYNFTPQKEDDLTNSLFTVAVQSNVANNVANLFSKDKLANDIGVPISYTFFFKTSAGLDDEDVDTLSMQRVFYYQVLRRKTIAELTTFNAVVVDGAAIDTVAKPVMRKELITKAANDFYDKELDLFEKQYPSFYTSWIRLQTFVPLSRTNYQVAPTNSLSFQAQNTRKWSTGIALGHIRENFWRWGAIFITGSVRVTRTNAIEQKDDRIKGFTQYSSLTSPIPSTQPQSTVYFDSDGAKAYVGNYDERWTVPLQAQMIYFFKSRKETKFGVDILFERYAVNYIKNNILFGIPVFLKGKEDKGVNVEAQFRLRDIDKSDIAGVDRFTVGLSVALPFGNIVK